MEYWHLSQPYSRIEKIPNGFYKIWEEGEIPRVVFEITSPRTKKEDDGFKKQLYEQIGIQEYWQFDPKGEWIPEKLRGYQLVGDASKYRTKTEWLAIAAVWQY